jgi:hypothetical protein
VIAQKENSDALIAELSKELKLKSKADKRAWLKARLDGFEAGKYTGRIVYVVEFNQGGISRLREEIFQSQTVAP